jgi:hypothetical protein
MMIVLTTSSRKRALDSLHGLAVRDALASRWPRRSLPTRIRPRQGIESARDLVDVSSAEVAAHELGNGSRTAAWDSAATESLPRWAELAI